MDPSSTPSTQISGFYGPGAWAAWVITLIASWISLIQSDCTHNLHFIGYSLYMNWAAVDLIRQISQAPQDHGHLEIDQARLENFVASSAVLSLGIYHVVAQIGLMLLGWKSLGSDSVRLVKRRLFILNLGLLIPLSATWWYVRVVEVKSQSFWVLGSSLLGQFVLVYSMCDLIGLNFPLVCLRVLLSTVSVFICPTFVMLYALRDGSLVPTYIDNIRPPSRCFIVPCAPQGIGELDQTFSLLVALFLWFYEFRFGWIINLKDNIQARFKGNPIADEESVGSRVTDEDQEAFENDNTSSSARVADAEL